MTVPTEQRNTRSTALDRLSSAEIVALMNHEEVAALDAVNDAAPEISEAAEHVAATYLDGGRVLYLGAGTSGQIAVMDAAEIPATFGVDPNRFGALIVGPAGVPAAITTSEDDEAAAPVALDASRFDNNDMVIGIAASGSTPFVVSGVGYARRLGCQTCGIANNPASPLLEAAALSIFLDTGPEVLTGSTRLKAGTAQKLALNRISTTAMVLAGRVTSNLMVELAPATAKLRDRCLRIVRELTGVEQDRAAELLEQAGWSIRAAVTAHNRTGG